MTKCKPVTLKEKRANALYTTALILSGNNKLVDYDDEETGVSYRYAQVNTRAIIDCPFRSAGCEKVCYATKGRHNCSNVKDSRERSANETHRKDFSDALIYTIELEKTTGRYSGKVMLIRIHESGDFYSVQYLKKWVKVWEHFDGDMSVRFVFYTKSFPFFLMLCDSERAIINRMIDAGQIAINLSVDDTTSREQWKAYHDMRDAFPKANTYYCTEHVDSVEHDNVCDCANCAKCGTCNKGTGKKTVVKIHSASKNDMAGYRENITAEA